MEIRTEVAELAKLAEGKPSAVFPLGLPVLLIRRGAEVFALENRCAHLGCPLVSGKLDGYLLQCPCHDWRFDIRDGKFRRPGAAVKLSRRNRRRKNILI
jgi:3-phenylpropionate/trans-cinnamate dioxygenase ferredoxin subunit